MILTCPNCASRFLLSAQVLAPDGRCVKCSACAEEWFEYPDPDELGGKQDHLIEDIPEAVKPLPDTSDEIPPFTIRHHVEEPPPKNNAALKGYMAALAVFALTLTPLLMFQNTVIQNWLPAAKIYEVMGMQVSAPGEGLVFDRVKARYTEDHKIIIEAQIINLTDETQFLPSIEVSVRDEQGAALEETLVHPPVEKLPPETTLPFESTYVGATQNADHVQLKFVLVDQPAVQTQAGHDTGHADEAQGSEHGQEHGPEHGADHSAKNDAAAADNTPEPHADDHAAPHGAAAH